MFRGTPHGGSAFNARARRVSVCGSSARRGADMLAPVVSTHAVDRFSIVGIGRNHTARPPFAGGPGATVGKARLATVLDRLGGAD